MNIFTKLSIRSKLILIALLPTLGLIYYLQQHISGQTQKRSAAIQLKADVEEIARYSFLLTELQKERPLLVNFAFSGGKSSSDALINQQQKTDDAINSLRALHRDYGKGRKPLLLLDSLPLIRTRAVSLKFTDRDNIAFLDGKTQIADEIAVLLRSSLNTELKNIFEDHLSIVYAKDYLGEVRGTLSQAITRGGFRDVWRGRFSVSVGKHLEYIRKLERFSEPELRKLFTTTYATRDDIQLTYAIIDQALEDPSLANFHHTFNDWFSQASINMDALREMENFSKDYIRNQADQQVITANSNMLKVSAVAGVLLVLVLASLMLILRDVINALNSIRLAADQITQGHTHVEIGVDSKDEIGELAQSFRSMITTTKEFAETARSIGTGDYSRSVQVRSSEDMLGNALENMRSNLQKLSHENETRTWLLSGSAELNNSIRGEKETKDLANEVVTHLVKYLRGQIGAFYLLKDSRLELIGSYAYQKRKNNTNQFSIGEGLVGQAALEKKSILFTKIPEDYVAIHSGLGDTIPHHVIVYPFLYEGDVMGVIEIGTAHEFSDLDLQFLDLISESVGIAFYTAESRAQLKFLLDQTQQQAEELESQQEELRQTNETLQEKTRLLEESESELKSQQEELQQANEELEEKANLLEEQKEKLEGTKIEIENKVRELEMVSKYKSEFLANMSHELRTPLNSILILAQLLSENKNNVLGEKEMTFAKNIYTSGTDLLNLINEILDLSKVEAGKMELEMEDIKLGDIANNLKSMFSEVAESRSIQFEQTWGDYVTPEMKIRTDLQRLEQILRNLLSNAFKFTDKGGKVTMRMALADSLMAFRTNQLSSGDKVLAFAISDTGIGIPLEKQGIIFEAFQQADGSTKRKYGGTGLGLSICRELANFLGGEIHLESKPGKGSTFTFYMPLQATDTSAHKNTAASHHPAAGNGTETAAGYPLLVKGITTPLSDIEDDRTNLSEGDRKVLIVEDDPDFAKLLLNFVRERNYKGIIARQGNVGLSYARHFKPNAILLDLRLPVMDGLEVLKQLKNDPSLRHIPVQILSNVEAKKEGMELGAFDYMEKPVTEEALQRVFDRLEAFVSKKFKQLLIVEDDQTQNKSIRELISDEEVKCKATFSGKEALAALNKERYDCIIIDLGLPDMSGFELLEKIKEVENFNSTPIIVYTAKDLNSDERAKLNKLANTVVLKTANSRDRLLDETTLFLHRVESSLPKEKQNIIRKLHKTDEVLKNKSVLVVDDDMRNIYSLANLLEEEGMKCTVAEDGKAALESLKKNPQVDIILMDVMMPEMDGYEATKAIRKISKYTKLPIIALTAKAMKGDREKCLAAGMSDYLAKPVNTEQLLSLMRVWLYQ